MKYYAVKKGHQTGIFDNWAAYLGKNGLDPTTIMHCNRENTKKRIKMVQKGKKWTKSRY